MPDRNTFTKSSASAWLVLLACLASTGIATYAVKSATDSDGLRQFDADCQEIQQKIEGRLQAHRLVLLGGAALFDASDKVSRDEWRAYARRVEIDQHFNGIQGLGFSLLIPKARLAAHIAGVRAEGFPDYTVLPAGERDEYSSIVYLEPFEGRNLRAFGYDMYSEPVRRAAMARARDENAAALSGKVELVQETGQDVQAGTLMYVPVYRKNMPSETMAQRSAALHGWVYSPFRMDDLLRGILGFEKMRGTPNLRLRVYDGPKADASTLLYDSEAGRKSASPAPAISLERRVDLNGREWVLHFDQLKSGAPGYGTAWLVFSSGLGLSLLSFLLMRSYLNTRREAARIADDLTAELRKTSGYTRSLIEASLDPFVTISPEGKITDVNHATEKATGLHRAKLTGTDFSDYFTEPDKARAGYRQAFMEGSVTDYPLAIRRQDGHIIEVLYNASVYHDEEGNVLGVFAAARDVTERKLMEAKLRELNNDFITLLENTSDFIYFKDKDSRIRFCSQTLADITGHRNWRDMIGKHDLEVFPEDTARVYYEEELPIFREGKALLNKTDPYYDAQGKPGWVNTNKWPVFGDDKKTVVGIFGISRDITVLKETEDQINRLNRELEQRVAERTANLEAANLELEEFAYSVAHDLRIPLRAIDGFSHQVRTHYGEKLDEEGRRLLDVVRGNTRKMGELMEGMLTFTRIGRMKMTPTGIDMEGLARTALDELRPAAAGRGLTVTIAPLPPAQGDLSMLHQVWTGLLSNALKFTRPKPETVIEVGGEARSGELVYHVRDNGVGFDPQYAHKLFGVSQRLHGIEEFEGVGVGLAIVKRIVTRHGGRVWAEGKVGEGATFYFALPLKP